jgi:hypothetical protein
MYENYNKKIYKYIFHQSHVSNFYVGFVIWNPLQKVQAQFALRESYDSWGSCGARKLLQTSSLSSFALVVCSRPIRDRK